METRLIRTPLALIGLLGFLTPLAALRAQEPATPPPAAPPAATPAPPTPTPRPLAIEIDLSAQTAWLLQDGKRVYETPISSGRAGHETPTGDFSVLEKDLDHKSSLYGHIVDSSGHVLISDADCDTPVPAGGKFVQAPMHHFVRFDGAIGMHAGRLPGYPASHGCVRLPSGKAALFYNIAELGVPVHVFGKAPHTGAPAPAKLVESAKATPAPTPAPARSFFQRLIGRETTAR